MMTNSKRAMLLVASTVFLFISCKKNTEEQTDSEQYYKAQLEKLIHLKEIPSSPNTQNTSSFKTYKEAYEAFAFVRTGEVFSATTTVTEVKAPKGSNTNQARGFNEEIRNFSISPNLSVSIGNFSSLGCRFTIDFICRWDAGPNPDEWIPSVAITKRSEPVYTYSGIGKITGYGSS